MWSVGHCLCGSAVYVGVERNVIMLPQDRLLLDRARAVLTTYLDEAENEQSVQAALRPGAHLSLDAAFEGYKSALRAAAFVGRVPWSSATTTSQSTPPLRIRHD